MNVTYAAVASPLLGAAVASLANQRRVRLPLRLGFGLISVAIALWTLPQVDRLQQIFIILISIVSFLALLFSVSIFPKIELADAHWASRPAYFMLLGAFWSSMLLVVYATTFTGVWIGISATTLATTFLVGFSGGKTALEAAWKYLILCSFGIAIALLGMLLVGRAALEGGIESSQALAWSALIAHSAAFPIPLLRTGLLLMTLGFATKAGLVPMHAWLPDAHSRAPAPISALLSGLLVSCSLYAIIRVQSATPQAIGHSVDGALLVLGSLSVLLASFLMLAQRDVKRFLSYSTVEHSGLVAVALGIHTPLAIFAAIYHIVNHAFAKTSAFMSIGVVQYARNNRNMFVASLVSLAAMPPFGMFFSELLIAIAAVQARQWAVLAIATSALLIGFAALARLALETCAQEEHNGQRPAAPHMALAATTCAMIAGILCSFAPYIRGIAP